MSSVFDSIPRIKKPLQLNFSTANGPAGSDASAGGCVDLVAETWQFSNVNDAGSNNYYLVSVTGSIFIDLHGTLKIDRYAFNFVPRNSNAKLIDYSPSTTIGNRSLTVGVSSSVSGSIGAFGDIGTVSVGASSSVSTSTSYSAPDVEIETHAYNGFQCKSPSNSNNALWYYKVSEGSNVQNGNLSVCMQMLFMAPTDTDVGTFTVDGTTEIHLSDHDGQHGTRWFDHMHEEISACLPPGSTFRYDDDRIGTITFPTWPIDIAVPPLPKSLVNAA